MSETVMSEYIKGFDHGCDYIIREIELQAAKASSRDALVLVDLIERLKMQGKYDLGKIPTK
jgi:hypothetical protein